MDTYPIVPQLPFPGWSPPAWVLSLKRPVLPAGASPLPPFPAWLLPGFHHLQTHHLALDGNPFHLHRGGSLPVFAGPESRDAVGMVIVDGNKWPYIIKVWSADAEYNPKRSYVKARIRVPDGRGERTDFLHLLIHDYWPEDRLVQKDRRPGLEIDHRNRKLWDCRSSNLELVPKKENLRRARAKRQKHGVRERWATLNPGANYNRRSPGRRLDPAEVEAEIGPRRNDLAALIAANSRLQQTLGRDPSAAEIGDALGLDVETVEKLRYRLRTRTIPPWARRLHFNPDDVDAELILGAAVSSLAARLAHIRGTKKIPAAAPGFRANIRLWLTHGELAAVLSHHEQGGNLDAMAASFGVPAGSIGRILRRPGVRQALIDWRPGVRTWPTSRAPR